MKLQTDDDQLMAMAAHRYCLGRSSYIVGACLDWLRDTWPQMTPNTQFVILRDTVDALAEERAGSPTIDAPGWVEAVAWMVKAMPPDRVESVRRALAWKGKPLDEYLGKAVTP